MNQNAIGSTFDDFLQDEGMLAITLATIENAVTAMGKRLQVRVV